jgi:hypothetical protein
MSKSRKTEPEGHDRIKNLIVEAEQQVQKERAELKTTKNTSKTEIAPAKNTIDTTQDVPQTSEENPDFPITNSQATNEDVENTPKPIENVSEPKLQVSEADLRKHRERLLKLKDARELLANGWSIRETAKELNLPKSLIEKLSKKVEREESITTSGSRREWVEKPYADALKHVRTVEEDEEEDDFEWEDRMDRKMRRRKWLNDKMKAYGLIGDNSPHSNTSDKLWDLLIAKSIGGSSTKDMAEMLSLLKSMGLLGEPDFMQKYAAMEGIKNQGIEKFQQMQTQAFQQAKASMDKGLVQQAIEKLAPIADNITKAMTTPKNIPAPTPQIPGPENPQLPQGEILNVASEQELEKLSLGGLPENQGYSNLESLRWKTALEER